jgi:protein TonB
MPPAPIIPAVKTFYIRFAESPVASTGGQDHVNREARPRALSVKRASRKETVPQERPQPLTEANPIATEKPAVTVNQEALGSVLPAVEPSGPLAGIVAGTAAAKGGGEVVAQTVFGEVGAPTFIHREIPAYPLMARRFGKEGKVILRLRINAKGNLQHIDVIEPSGFGFTEAAIEAVRKSTFSPARRGGSPVASEAILAVRFVLM